MESVLLAPDEGLEEAAAVEPVMSGPIGCLEADEEADAAGAFAAGDLAGGDLAAEPDFDDILQSAARTVKANHAA